MSELLFIFGNTPELALYEAKAVLRRLNIVYREISYNDHVWQVSLGDNFQEKDAPLILIRALGGTVKIARVISQVERKRLEEAILDLFSSQFSAESKKLTFGISWYGTKPLLPLKILKESLAKSGKASRFFLPAPGKKEISSVVVTTQNLAEVIVFSSEGRLTIGLTTAVQDYAAWGKRDYERPAAQGHIGMLPPKVARMMVNLGLGQMSKKPTGKYLFADPFCGTGTILAEALLCGCRVFGVDLDPEQVARCRKNLQWLAGVYQISPDEFQITAGDARNLKKEIGIGAVDCLVTEPDLGPNQPGRGDPGEIKSRLEKLYLDCFADWRQALTPIGCVAIALPSFVLSRGGCEMVDDSLVKIVIDKVVPMGYSLAQGPYIYGRPQARVKRNICIFKRV